MTHSCIKCKSQYDGSEPEAYYCPKCNDERKLIAAEIDKKIRPESKTMSDLQIFDSVAKTSTKTQVSEGVKVTVVSSYAKASDIM